MSTSNTTAGRPLRVACIGYAFMGKAHSAAWREVGAHFDVPAPVRQVLVGRDDEQVNAAARKYGWAQAATDWREVMTREDVDIIDICTPGYTNEEIANDTLEDSKHELVIKPI